MDEYQFNI